MRRTLLLLRALAVLGLLAAGSLALLAGPDPGRQVGLRQKADGGSGRKEEEEEDKPAPPKRKDVARFEDPDDKGKAAPPAAPTGNLKEAARRARHQHVKALYEGLATPHDQVKFKKATHVTSGGNKLVEEVLVEPLPDYHASARDNKRRLELHVLDRETMKRAQSYSSGAGAVASIRYYEQLAGDAVAKFLEQPYHTFDPKDKLHLARFTQLTAAEAVLSRVMAFHRSARKRGVRKGDEWGAVEEKLESQLLGVLIGKMEELTRATSYDAAFALSKELIDTYTSKEQHARIAKPLAELLKKSLGDTATSSRAQLREARMRLQQIEDRFPGSEVITEISKSLKERAGKLAKEAQKLKETDKERALALVEQAEQIWPELAGLRDLRVELGAYNQVLRVGVASLPKYLSPGWATTDSELRAVELMFESLVDLVPDGRGSHYYRSVLAQGRPRVIPLGRELKLPRQALWSTGKALTMADVTFTLKHLQKGSGRKDDAPDYRCRLTGRIAAWGDLLAGLKMENDPYRLKVLMTRGRLDPLGAMSFKVMPRIGRPDPAGEAFALAPKLSSGPFQYAGPGSENGKAYVGFEANPHYGTRIDRVGKPLLSKVRFFVIPTGKPAKELASAVKDHHPPLDLVLDLTAGQAAALKADEGWAVPVPDPATTPNRRVYFLAANHRGGASNPLSDADVRVALARAIDREGLLDEFFRKGLKGKVHRALNGPYPAGSWACDPKLAGKATDDPYDAAMARAKLGEALKRLGVASVRLKLKYPAGDARLKAAMAALCAGVTKAVPQLKLTPVERDAHDLRKDVEVTHDYDLAYYSYDYPDESLWLFPLLGPSGRRGSDNFLGYNGALVGRAQQMASLRHFSQVRDQARRLHKEFLESEMPLVPLWQLAPLYAYRKDKEGALVLPPIDPQRVFTRVEEWYKKGE